MSSLSQQLKAISDKTASVALDRKTRSRIHLRSVIFAPKVAATQDYDYLYLVGREGFDELCDIDKRFVKFGSTIFSDQSIQTDRDVEDQTAVAHLKSTLSAFMELLGPYYQLNPAVKALEWLIRRFYVNIHEPEALLMLVLPHHNTSIFLKVLNVIPKTQMPELFSWLNGFKEPQLTNPLMQAVSRAFYTDYDLWRTYTRQIELQLANGTMYLAMLGFYVLVTIQVLALILKDPSTVADKYLTLVLTLVSKLLNSKETDHKLSAFLLVAIVSTIVPLSTDIISGITSLILAGYDLKLIKETYIILGQLWHYYSGDFSDFDDSVLSNLRDVDFELMERLLAQEYHMQRFLMFLFLSTGSLLLLKLIGLTSSDRFFQVAVQKAISLDEVAVAQYLFSADEAKFTSALESQNMTLEDAEMKLLTTLRSSKPEVEHSQQVVPSSDAMDEAVNISSVSFTSKTFFAPSATKELVSLMKLMIKFIASSESKATESIQQFSQTVFNTKYEVAILFLIAVGYSPVVPLQVRLGCFSVIAKLMPKQKGSLWYLLIPVLIAGSVDENDKVRHSILALLRKVCDYTISGKDSEDPVLVCEDQIYDNVSAEDKAILPPAEASSLAKRILPSINDMELDHYRVVLVLFDDLFVVLKLGVLYQTFILNQWSLPFVLPIKYLIWAIMGHQNTRLLNGSDDRGFFYETDVVNYDTNRGRYTEDANFFGIEFEDVETNVASMVGGKGPSDVTDEEVSWMLKSLSVTGLDSVVSKRVVSLFNHGVFDESQEKLIVSKLVGLAVDETSDVDAASVLQELILKAPVVVYALQSVNLELPDSEPTVAKRRRRSLSFAKSVLANGDAQLSATLHLRKLSVVLDTVVLGMKSHRIPTSATFLEPLFDILTDLDLLGHDGNLPILYPQELLVQSMLAVLQGSRKEIKDLGIRVDVIVNCLRNAESPQLQNRLLLVIAELAHIVPEMVLHSIMPIFTFMGAQTVRQDDEFSQLTLLHTISTVVPPLIELSPSLVSLEIEFLLTLFVATFHHIPHHRRVSLFVNLSHTLGVNIALPLMLFLVGQQQVKLSGLLFSTFANEYLQHFSAEEQLLGLNGVLELWNSIPNEQIASGSDEYLSLANRLAFGVAIALMNTENLVVLKTQLLQFFTELDTDDLKLRLNIAVAEGSSGQFSLDQVSAITSWCLTTIDTFTSVTPNKDILKYAYLLLTKVLDLLPLVQFVDSVIGLLEPSQIQGDEVAVSLATNYAHLLGKRFEQLTTKEDAQALALAHKLLPVLSKGFSSEMPVDLQQAYIDAFATIVQLVTISENKQLLDAMDLMTPNLINLGSAEVVIALCNAIGIIVTALGVGCIRFFPKIVPPAIRMAESIIESEDEESHTLVLTAILMLFLTMVKHIPKFMVLSLSPILAAIIRAHPIDGEIRKQMLHVVLSHIDPPDVLKLLCAIWPAVVKSKDATAFGLYLAIMDDTVQQAEKKQAIRNAGNFFKWVINAFEFGGLEDSVFPVNTVQRLENSVFSTVIQFIMKLNDKTFRPSFVKLVRWMVDGEDATPSLDLAYRYKIFLRFFVKLQDELRGIITLYFSYLVDPISQLLSQYAEGSIKNDTLHRIVLNALTSSFKFDNDDYWAQQGRFEAICQPLLDQIQNAEVDGSKHLVKAITLFVADVSSDDYNETLINGLIKYLSPDTSLGAKICTIRILKNVFQKMGDQWLSFLPTMIPYIAELLEDDDEKVELEVRQGLVKVIEKVLGEPLDRYLE